MKFLAFFLVFFLSCVEAKGALRGTASQINTSTSTTVTVSVSSIGIEAGDIVLLYLAGGSGTSNIFTLPSGFAVVPGLSEQGCGAEDDSSVLAYKIASTEPSSYTATYSVDDFLGAVVRVYSDRNTTSPFTAKSPTVVTALSGASPATVPWTGVTPLSGDDIVGFACFDSANPGNGTGYVFNAPTGWANPLTSWSAVQYGMILGSADEVGSNGGSTGTINASLTFSTGLPGQFSGYVVSLAAGATSHECPCQGFLGASSYQSSVDLAQVVMPERLLGGAALVGLH